MATHAHRSTAGASIDAPIATGDDRRWWILALIGIAQTMLIIDVTVVNVALPSIGRDLDLDRAGLTWVVTTYTLFFGSLLLLGGRLADTRGRRRMFLIGISIFTAASLASGLSPDGRVLIVARAAQGIGAALLAPAALSIITMTFQGQERARALAVWAALGGIGAVLGVILGGFLAAGPGWQWIFFINVPIGVLVALGVGRFVGVRAFETDNGRVDLVGATVGTTAVGVLLFGLIRAGDTGWTSIETIGTLVVGLAIGGLFLAVESRVREPLVRLPLLAVDRLGGPLMVMLAAAGLLAGSFFLNSLYLQRVVGQTPLETGLTFVPVALALILGAQAGAHAIGRFGPRPVAVAGLLVGSVGLAYLGRLPERADVLVDLLPGFVLAAAGIGSTFVSATTGAFSRVGSTDAGMASGLVNTAHELGFATGVAVLSAVAATSISGGVGVVGGFQSAFLVAAGAAVIAAIAAATFVPAEGTAHSPGFVH